MAEGSSLQLSPNQVHLRVCAAHFIRLRVRWISGDAVVSLTKLYIKQTNFRDAGDPNQAFHGVGVSHVGHKRTEQQCEHDWLFHESAFLVEVKLFNCTLLLLPSYPYVIRCRSDKFNASEAILKPDSSSSAKNCLP